MSFGIVVSGGGGGSTSAVGVLVEGRLGLGHDHRLRRDDDVVDDDERLGNDQCDRSVEHHRRAA